MEYLDYYDEQGTYLGYKTRKEVHEEGLWHNTVHCWLYDENGNIYFQIRTDSNTLYTTASGHVLKGETINDAFKREIFEEIGLSIDSSDATLVDIVTWKMDKKMKDGSLFKDRAKANVYVDLFEGNFNDLKFDVNEVLGLVKVNAEEALKLFKKGIGQIEAEFITPSAENNIKFETKCISIDAFLVNEGETAYTKYGQVLRKVVELTKKDVD